MDIQELTEKINSLDINDIDWNNMGSWPLVGRVVFAIIVFVGVLTASYFLDVNELVAKVDKEVNREATLKKDFGKPRRV